MWGIIPAAGAGSRIQPLAFSKELLPVGNRITNGREQPRAVSEYLVERMIDGGADKLCFVISPFQNRHPRVLRHASLGSRDRYMVQPRPAGLCDALFRPAPSSTRRARHHRPPRHHLAPAGRTAIAARRRALVPALSRRTPRALRRRQSPRRRPRPADSRQAARRPSTLDLGRLQNARQRLPPASPPLAAPRAPGRILRHPRQRLARRRRPRPRRTHAGTSYIDTGTLSGYRTAMGLLDPRQQQQLSVPMITVGEEA